MSRLFLPAALAAMVFAMQPALAQSPQDLAQNYFYASELAERDAARAALAESTAPEAHFASGVITIIESVETFILALGQHGISTPAAETLNDFLGLPAPAANPTGNYEPITYQKLRDILDEFDQGLTAAANLFAAIPEDADFGLNVDLAKFNVNTGTQLLSFAAVGTAMIDGDPDFDTSDLPERTVRFDRADAYWFEGYTHVIRATFDLIMAHDFERSFDLSFRLFFPQSMPPSPLTQLPDGLDPMGIGLRPDDTRNIADAITLIHTLDWPVIDPARRAGIGTHILEMIRLSRITWESIGAETDDDNEWLPGPQQTDSEPLSGEPVTEKQVAAWHRSLTMFEAVLEGRLLLPHWRFPGYGINLKSLLEGDENLDFVLMLTGPGFLPYLEQGKVLNAENFTGNDEDFGPLGFFGTALWFN